MPFLTVAENYALQQQISRRLDPDLWQRYGRDLDLSDVAGKYPATLSVGQRQRAAVVRAAACRPAVLLADEPTSACDPDLKDAVIGVLKTAAADGSAVVMVTHELALIERHGLIPVAAQSEREATGWRTRFSDTAQSVAA